MSALLKFKIFLILKYFKNFHNFCSSGIRYFQENSTEFKGKKACTDLQYDLDGSVQYGAVRNFQDISNKEECKVAARALGTIFSQVWNHNGFPSRCHIIYSNTTAPSNNFTAPVKNIVYWNEHPSGSANRRSGPICKVGKLI